MTELLLTLLRWGIGRTETMEKDNEVFLNLSMHQWQLLMTLAEKQGVAAIAFDGVQRLYQTSGRETKAAAEHSEEWMRWVLECTGMMSQYEKRSIMQKKVIAELSEIWHEQGIRMMVFKGQANASLYPVPQHRATGDIDCFLFGEAERGDAVLAALGATVSNNWYRHSKISYQGETIENHRVLGHTRGSKTKKKMEQELMALLKQEKWKTIKGCAAALMPPALFNACFLTYHSMHHFISEGLRMKQILDWAVFLQSQQKDVDWEAYNTFCKMYKLNRFAGIMNYIAVHCLGIKVTVNGVLMDGQYAEKILQTTLYDDDYLFNSGKSDWAVRWLLVKNMLTRDRWKYRDIAQQNVVAHLWHSARGYLFDKD